MSAVSPEYLRERLASLAKLRALSTARPRVAVARLYGVQEATPEQIYLWPDLAADPNHLISKIVPSWLGDGTVIDYSAMQDNDLGRLPGAVLHERIMSDTKIIAQVKAALVDRAPPESISGAPLATCMTSDGSLDIDGATLDGSDRVVVPGQEVEAALSIRSSVQMPDPNVLRTIAIEARVVSPEGFSALKFNPIGQSQFGNERTKYGITDFFVQNFATNFPAPKGLGDARIEIRCNVNQDEAVTSWDFKVAQ
jgi:hypothetical protein